MNNYFSKTLFARLACLVLTLLTVLHVDAQLFIQKPGLVQVTNSGTAIAVSFTNQLSTSTNVALASVTSASPLPVYLTTNGVNVTNQISVSTNVSLANVTAAAPLPVYAVTNSVNATNDVNLNPTNVIGVTFSGNIDLDPTNILAGITGNLNLNPTNVIGITVGANLNIAPTNVLASIASDVNLSPTNVIHVTIDGGTNTLEVSAAIPVYQMTNNVNVTNNVNLAPTNSILVGNTASAPVPVFLPTNLVSGTVTVSNATLTVAGVVALTNTAAAPVPIFMPTNSMAVNTQTNIGGFTYVGTGNFPVDQTSQNIVANDAYATNMTITSAVRSTAGTGLLTSLCCISGDNRAPAFTLLISADALTWPATSATATLVQTEIATNLLGIVDFATSDFKQIGTNYIATKGNLNIGVKPLATTLYLYAVSQMSITNTNAYTLKWTILQD